MPMEGIPVDHIMNIHNWRAFPDLWSAAGASCKHNTEQNQDKGFWNTKTSSSNIWWNNYSLEATPIAEPGIKLETFPTMDNHITTEPGGKYNLKVFFGNCYLWAEHNHWYVTIDVPPMKYSAHPFLPWLSTSLFLSYFTNRHSVWFQEKSERSAITNTRTGQRDYWC